jgi:hypothetical protein
VRSIQRASAETTREQLTESRDADVGRSTRSQDLQPAQAPWMFDDAGGWKDIEPSEYEGEEVEAEDGDVTAALDAPDVNGDDGQIEARSADPARDEEDDDAPAALAAMPSDAVDVGSREDEEHEAEDEEEHGAVARAAAVGAAEHPHASPFEHSAKKPSGHDAKQDKHNNKHVRSNRVGTVKDKKGKKHKNPNQIGRPGLRVKGRDEFHLRGDFAYRYQIVNGSKAVAVDKIWEKELQHGRDKEGQRLALNPSAPRRLFIDGVGVWCVMSWAGAQSAAWIAIKDLEGKFADIKGKASQMSKRWNPKNATKAQRDHATEMKFRAVGDPVGSADDKDEHRYIVPGQKKANGNEVGDYLIKDVLRRNRPGGKAASESKRLESHHKGALEIEGGMRGLISIVGNLPHDKTPPVAIDVARPGVDTFFVPKGSTFRREISLYKRRASKTKLRQNWVFGYVGRDEGTHKVPDTKRRGWVPRRVLAKL